MIIVPPYFLFVTPMHGSPDTIDKIFTGALCQFLTLRKYAERTVGLKMTSVTDDVYDWPLQNKIIGCATSYKLFI